MSDWDDMKQQQRERLQKLLPPPLDAHEKICASSAPKFTPRHSTFRNIWRRLMAMLSPKQRRDEYLREKERQRNRALTFVPNVSSQVAPAAVSDAASLAVQSPSEVHRFVKPEPVLGEYRELPEIEPAVIETRFEAAGRIIPGTVQIIVAIVIGLASIAGSMWFGFKLSTDYTAGTIFSTFSVCAEILALVIPTTSAIYWQLGRKWMAFQGWGLMLIVWAAVFISASGFVLTNVGDKTTDREQALIETADVQNKRSALKTAKDLWFNECGCIEDAKGKITCTKVGNVCRQHANTVTNRQTELNDAIAKAEKVAKHKADPQATALGITSEWLRLIQAGVLVSLCLFAGFILKHGWGLVFSRTRT
jgi:hypothetical protein